MKIKLSDYVASFFVKNNINDVFMVTGGGAMHLDDSLGHNKNLHITFNHHEQACAIAAEGYARLTNKIALISVTSGPGGTNTLTGVVGGWLDSIPMFILSGQVKRETTIWSSPIKLRQLGDQELNIIDMVKPITKYAVMVTEPNEIRYHLEKALYLATSGRKGPVWVDIPLDVQASTIETDDLKGFDKEEVEVECPKYEGKLNKEILEKINNSKKPLLLVGEGVRFAGAEKEVLELINQLQIPVVTAWNAHDLVADSNPFYAGRPGTVGTRGGNFAIQDCDLLLVIGCRLNIRQISYNYKDFAKNAYKIMVDIEQNEIDKKTLSIDLKVHSDAKEFITSFLSYINKNNVVLHELWLKHCVDLNKKYPATLKEYYKEDYPLNPYVFVTKMFENLKGDDVVVCGNGSACVMGFQGAIIKENTRLFTNSGCASMGYGFPASIGAAIARKGKRVMCLDGDGSFQMNIQEMQTVIYNNLNLKIFYLNNDGYHSIRQTQNNLFHPPLIGVNEGNGLSFPDMSKLAPAYGMKYVKIDKISNIDSGIKEALSFDGPCLIDVVVDPKQIFSPKLSSKVLPDEKIVSPSLDDMFPFLSREEYEGNKFKD